MWDTVLPDAVVPIRSDLLLVDRDGSSMQAIRPKAISRRFSTKIVEGCVYKFTRFDIVVCRLSYLAMPSEYIIYLNSSTSLEEITESISRKFTYFDYPRHFFRFATLEDLRARNEKSRILTDIGVLTIIGSKTNVKRASGNSSTNRRDIMIKMLRLENSMEKNSKSRRIGREIQDQFLVPKHQFSLRDMASNESHHIQKMQASQACLASNNDIDTVFVQFQRTVSNFHLNDII
ncbi:Retrotransposon-like protein [Corchorus capsularis]|uniref:Retrotransposon-like protein n=1 Tax=Corchorus capsularis TaxID=210143 RepID=A0A1R3GIL6_COCAP|nr:Retrotransposon-like protein [Corchorus capsularis]